MSGETALDRTFKLSFIAYLKAVVAAAVEVAVLVFLRDRIDGVGKYFGLVLFGIFLFLAWRLLSLWMVRWRVTDRGLEVKGGVLPWRRFHRSIPYAAIFEAYYNRGFVGYVCRYGTVTVRRSEGATSALIQKGMHNARTLQGLINNGVASHRAAMTPGSLAAPAVTTPGGPTAVEHLAELARLKASGDITEAEYVHMKGKIIGADTPPPDGRGLVT